VSDPKEAGTMTAMPVTERMTAEEVRSLQLGPAFGE
jgi:hypothetical protein